MKKGKLRLKTNLAAAFLLVLAAFLLANIFLEIEVRPKGKGAVSLGADEQKAVQAFLKFKKIKSEAIPSGEPDIYGQELGVNFDQVQESMDKMRPFGPTYGSEDKKIVLEGKELERFIKIGKQTSCQYCCGVEALIDDEGRAACGCAHSIVMRGLAAYLIKNHSDKFSDEEILAEINEWKKVFFPKQTLSAKFDELKEAGDEEIENLLQEFPDFLPQMVGGC